MLTPPTAFPICTIANTPRLPEHCIEWASILEWPRVFKDRKVDNDDPEHIQWLFDTARTRAEQYKIDGVTWSLTQGVVKRIIPAIASTNAIVSAACCNEAFKIATSSNPYLSNYMCVAPLPCSTDGDCADLQSFRCLAGCTPATSRFTRSRLSTSRSPTARCVAERRSRSRARLSRPCRTSLTFCSSDRTCEPYTCQPEDLAASA